MAPAVAAEYGALAMRCQTESTPPTQPLWDDPHNALHRRNLRSAPRCPSVTVSVRTATRCSQCAPAPAHRAGHRPQDRHTRARRQSGRSRTCGPTVDKPAASPRPAKAVSLSWNGGAVRSVRCPRSWPQSNHGPPGPACGSHRCKRICSCQLAAANRLLSCRAPCYNAWQDRGRNCLRRKSPVGTMPPSAFARPGGTP